MFGVRKKSKSRRVCPSVQLCAVHEVSKSFEPLPLYHASEFTFEDDHKLVELEKASTWKKYLQTYFKIRNNNRYLRL